MGYLTVSEQGLIQRANLAAATLLGAERGALVRERVSRFIVREAEDSFYLLRHKLMSTGVPQSLELRMAKLDGTQFRAHVDASIVQDEAGAPVLRMALSDASERWRSDEALRESEAQKRALLTAIPDLIFVNRRNGEYLAFHASDPGMLAAPPEEFLHHRVEEVLPGPVAGLLLAAFALALDCGEVQEVCYALRISGEEKHFEARVAPSTDDTVITIVRDISARKAAEARHAVLESQLQHARKLESVGRLAGGVAHDFNNMLGVILGNTELALAQADPARSLHADLLEIQKAARRSADLTRQLLAFARKQPVAPRVMDLNETVPGMLAMLQRLLGEDIQLTWRAGADLWPVRMDPSQMDQILITLCVNARDAIADVGAMSIASANRVIDAAFCALYVDAVPGDYVQLTVSDTGCGMSAETLTHIFEPFFTTKAVGEGTGLGLATVYGAVRQNHGFIRVSSELGMGTSFEIHLPRYAGQGEGEREVAAALIAPAQPGRETILLVEDEPAVLRLTQRALEARGYLVLGASSPGAAIHMAEAHAGDIHLLLTDVVMPQMNGRDLARTLTTLYPHLKCLFMSGYPAIVIAGHGGLDNETLCLEKPFSLAALDDKVRAALDRAPSPERRRPDRDQP